MSSALRLAPLLLLTACGAGAQSTPSDTFIALQRDFVGFEGWEAFAPPAQAGGATHLVGPYTVYLKARPEHGSAHFPIGTVIVKSARPDALMGEEKIFAMVKRGGEYNAEGASGWEWFELARSTSGAPVILWRGVGAPAGEKYSQVDGSCNSCHQGSMDNDFVQSIRLVDL